MLFQCTLMCLLDLFIYFFKHLRTLLAFEPSNTMNVSVLISSNSGLFLLAKFKQIIIDFKKKQVLCEMSICMAYS